MRVESEAQASHVLPNEAEVNAMGVQALRPMLRQHGIISSGKKDGLRARAHALRSTSKKPRIATGD